MVKRSKPVVEGGRPFAVGDFFGFRMLPSFAFSVQDRPRFGVFRVFEVAGAGGNEMIARGIWPNSIATVTLQCVFDVPPNLEEVAKLPVQWWERPGAFAGRHAVFAVPRDQPTDPNLELRWLGNVALTRAELKWFRNVPFNRKPYGPWAFIGIHAESEWRWLHDRERFLADRERSMAERRAAAAAEEERYRIRLKGLTWEKLLSETHFERWTESPPFPPSEFTEAARGTINRTIRTITALGAKPKKAAVRAALRECVEWFNVEAARAGEVIETEEREDIMQLLADICFVARHRSLIEEIDEWRTW